MTTPEARTQALLDRAIESAALSRVSQAEQGAHIGALEQAVARLEDLHARVVPLLEREDARAATAAAAELAAVEEAARQRVAVEAQAQITKSKKAEAAAEVRAAKAVADGKRRAMWTGLIGVGASGTIGFIIALAYYLSGVPT